MVGIKSLWASIQGDPIFMRKVNGWFTIFWITMIPISIALGLLSSVAYVSALSLWALVSGHWSAWQAARVEVAQQAEEQKQQEHPIEQRVVAEVLKQTDVQPASPPPLSAQPTEHATSAVDRELVSRIEAITAQLQQLQSTLTRPAMV